METARRAIREHVPGISLRRLRLRQAAGRHFVDVVIGVSPGAAVAQGHAAADAVEDAVRRALPEADVIVHVEPQPPEEVEVRELAQEAALRVPDVREVHNVNVLTVDGRTEISLHLKLPGTLSLDEAHGVAEQVERTILDAVPEATAVRTHLEPLAEIVEGRRPSDWEVEGHMEAVLRIVTDELGAPPRGLRMLETGDGLVLLPDARARPAHGARCRARAGKRRRRADPPRATGRHRCARPYGALT